MVCSTPQSLSVARTGVPVTKGDELSWRAEARKPAQPWPPPGEHCCTFPSRFHAALLVRVELPDVHEDLPLEAGHFDITHLPDLQQHRACVKPSPATSCSAACKACWVPQCDKRPVKGQRVHQAASSATRTLYCKSRRYRGGLYKEEEEQFLEQTAALRTWNMPSSSLPCSASFSGTFEGLASAFSLFSDLEDVSFFLF